MWIAVILETRAWDNLMARLETLGSGSVEGLLAVLLAALVMAVGWVLATLLAAAARVLLRAVRFNEGMRGAVGGALRHEPASLAGWAVYWTILLVAATVAIDTMGFGLGASVSARLAEVLPRVVAAAILMVIGVLAGILVGGVVTRFFQTASLKGGRLWGQVVTVAITGFAVLVSLEQLGFAAQFVMGVGLVALGGAGLALGLAFGLGCRDLARDFVVEYLRSLDEQPPQRPA